MFIPDADPESGSKKQRILDPEHWQKRDHKNNNSRDGFEDLAIYFKVNAVSTVEQRPAAKPSASGRHKTVLQCNSSYLYSWLNDSEPRSFFASPDSSESRPLDPLLFLASQYVCFPWAEPLIRRTAASLCRAPKAPKRRRPSCWRVRNTGALFLKI
jgi:hypothetical protein